MSVEFSIIICTYNREDLLSAALKSACEQCVDPQIYEILVVDNNSTDNTRQVVQEFSSQFPNVRYLFESQIGLSYARNCGWQNAEGDYIGYIDDDCKLPPQWLAAARQIIERHAPCAFGGPALPFFNGPSPSWFKTSYGKRDLKQGFWANPSQLHGNNMVIRRNLLMEFGGFDTRLGMKGTKIAYGEETRFFDRLAEKYPGNTLYYDPDFFLYHLVRSEKMSFQWLIRGFFAKGRYSYLTLHENRLRKFGTGSLILNSCKMTALVAYDLTLGALLRGRTEYPHVKNYYYEHTSHYLKSLGRLYAKMEVERSRRSRTDAIV